MQIQYIYHAKKLIGFERKLTFANSNLTKITTLLIVLYYFFGKALLIIYYENKLQ
jgi:hypothetical protein